VNARRCTIVATIVLAGSALLLGQGESVVNSPHNLSVSGPGVVRASTEEQVCIFCHTPHNAAPIQPLWNRNEPMSAYLVYSSNALDAEPGQPTGSSKMCLSCHDGTIALGSVVSRDQEIRMAGGITTLPPGRSNLGTDLSDDHPISFRFDTSLVAKDPHLVDPHLLPSELKLDPGRELQCTTCHEPHDNSFGHFLVMPNDTSALCRACHQISTTTVPTHEDCRSCHQTHTAPSGPYLLTEETISDSCLSCHDGLHPPAKNIAADLAQLSVHDTDSPVDPPDPIPGHSTCADCHEPHTMHRGGATVAPNLQLNLGRVSGVSASGAPVDEANYEYEVCFKCHADDNAILTPYISRRITQTNTRLEFAPSAVSFHPVESPGRSTNVPSLKSPYTESSIIYCSDCHNSTPDTTPGSSAARGVHGSPYPPLLAERYETADFTPESSSSYALCYTCHDRTGPDGILSDRSFPHDLHVRQESTPCSVCHDAHGISSAQGNARNNAHLINFDTTVVFPDPITGRIEYESLGMFTGSCTLSCHGFVHSDLSYPAVGFGGAGGLRP
jgi:predicted CXXCH cytochrome family protein